MTTTTDLSTTAHAATVAYECEHGELSERERLIFQVGYADGVKQGVTLGMAAVDTAVVDRMAFWRRQG